MHGHGHVHGHVHAACACGAHDTRLAVAPWQALTGKQLEAVVGSVDAKNPALMLIAAYVAHLGDNLGDISVRSDDFGENPARALVSRCRGDVKVVSRLMSSSVSRLSSLMGCVRMSRCVEVCRGVSRCVEGMSRG